MSPLSSFKLTVNFIKEHKQVIAYSPALDISTTGKSVEHAKKRFQELVKIFWDDITERNVIDQVLTELGWTKIFKREKSQWIPPVVTSVEVRVPVAA